MGSYELELSPFPCGQFGSDLPQELAGRAANERSMEPKGYVCYRAAETVEIDGDLRKAVWQAAAWTDDFVDIEGDLRPLPRFRTRAKMLWDDRYFYVAVEMEEPHVWATLTERDTVIFQDNDFEVFIDPDGDNHLYYELEVNALNTVWDLLLPKPYRDGGPAINGWDIAGLKTAVQVQGTLNDPTDMDRGWTVEIALPWTALKECTHQSAPPHHGDQWRVNFSRVEWQIDIVEGEYRKVAGTREDNWVWSPQGVVDMHRPEHWGYVQFSTEEAGTTPFLPDPALHVRQQLMQVYYHQRAFRKEHGRYATHWFELGEGWQNGSGGPLSLETTSIGFVASATVTLPDGSREHWRIQQDSRLWAERE
jgi:hypothetical protein